MSDGILKRGERYVARPYDPFIGKPRWLGTFSTKKAARQAVAEFRVSRSSPEKMRLSAFGEVWVEQMKERVRERTIADYETTIKQLVAIMHDPPLNAITPKTVEQMVADSSRRYSGNTVRKQLTRLRQMLSTAVRWGSLTSNPAEGKMPLPKANKRQVIPLSPEEASRLVDAADDYYKPLFLLALTTGLRWGEMFGLTWADLDLAAGTLTVRHALYQGRLTDVKSDMARRTIHLPKQTVDALESHREVCPVTKLDLVFPAPWGRPFAPKTWSESVMIPTAKRAEMPTIRLHDLRHVFASLLIREGVSRKLLQSLLGHATITRTEDLYGHLFPDEKAQVAVMVGEYFGRNSRKCVAAKDEKA